MNFFESFSTCLRKYFVFKGRASRPEYWYFILFNTAVTVIMFFSVALQLDIVLNITVIYSLAVLIPSLAVTVRRFHDLDMSGWFSLLYFATSIPYIGLIMVAILWYLTAKKGTEGENRYGLPPVK